MVFVMCYSQARKKRNYQSDTIIDGVNSQIRF